MWDIIWSISGIITCFDFVDFADFVDFVDSMPNESPTYDKFLSWVWLYYDLHALARLILYVSPLDLIYFVLIWIHVWVCPPRFSTLHFRPRSKFYFFSEPVKCWNNTTLRSPLWTPPHPNHHPTGPPPNPHLYPYTPPPSTYTLTILTAHPTKTLALYTTIPSSLSKNKHQM